MTHTEMRALKLSDISQTPTKFYPQLIKAASGLFNGVEDYLFFQTYPLALIRINKPTYEYWPNKHIEEGATLSRSMVQEEKWIRELFTDARISGLSKR